MLRMKSRMKWPLVGINISEELIQKFLIHGTAKISVEGMRAGAIAQIIDYDIRGSLPTNAKQDMAGIDATRDGINFQTKGYVGWPGHIYLGRCAKDERLRKYFEDAKQMIVPLHDGKIEDNLKDSVFKNEFFDLLTPLIEYDIIDHFAIWEQEKEYQLVITLEKRQVIDNLDLCRIERYVNEGKDFVIDTQKIINRIIGE